MSQIESVPILTQVVDVNGIVSVVQMADPRNLQDEQEIETEMDMKRCTTCFCPQICRSWRCTLSAKTRKKLVTARDTSIQVIAIVMTSNVYYDVSEIIMELTDNYDWLFQVFLSGGIVWNMLLLIFWLTWEAADEAFRMEPGAMMKFRIWFIYTLVCYILFVSTVFVLLFKSPRENCIKHRLCELYPHISLWFIIIFFSFSCLFIAFYVIAILNMVLGLILRYRARRRQRPLLDSVAVEL